MDTAFLQDRFENFREVWSGAACCDAGTEIVVPDTMPDIGAILDTEGLLLIRGKQAEADSVTVSATVSVSVLYAPEDGGEAQSIQLTIPAELRAEAPGVEPECRMVVQLRARSLDARTVNPRKIAVKAELASSIVCYAQEEFSLASGSAAPQSGLCVKRDTARLALTTDVREKTFVITDEYAPGAGFAPEKILAQRVQLIPDDTKIAGGKLIFRGRARVFLLMAGGEPAQLYPGSYETEFSQITEIACGPEAAAEMRLLLTGAYFDLPDGGQGKIAAELHLAAQAVCREEREVVYVSDAYSNAQPLEPLMTTLNVAESFRPVFARQTVMGYLELPGDGAEALFFRSSVGSVTNAGGNVAAAVIVRAVFRRKDGSMGATSVRLSAEFAPELPEDSELVLTELMATEVFSVPAAGGVDVRVPLELWGCAVRRRELNAVQAMQEGEPAASPAPSLTLLRVKPGDDLWQIAKRYHSAEDAIAAANGGKTEGLLLIPRAK